MQDHKSRRIIAIVNGIDGQSFPTFTIRIENVFKQLKSQGFELNFMKYDEYLRTSCKADYLVVQRFVSQEVGSSIKLAEALVSKAKNESSFLIFDVDDNFEELDHVMSLKLFKNIEIYDYLKIHADLILVSTTELQKKLEIYTRTFLMPNYMIQDPINSKSFPLGNEIIFGYVGNTDRILDLITVLVWFYEHIGNKNRIVFDSLGMSDEGLRMFRDVLPGIEFRNSTPVKYEDLHHWISQRNWTASIAPLEENPFNSCKSAIKLIDYSWNSAPIGISAVGETNQLFGESLPELLLEPVDSRYSKSNWLNWLQRILTYDPEIIRNDQILRARMLEYRGSQALKSQIELLTHELISISETN